jgi:hypothetical protein
MPDAPPLPATPLKRPNCGKEATTGAIASESIRPLTPANVASIGGSGDSALLTSAGTFAWSESPKTPAFEGADCGITEPGPEV